MNLLVGHPFELALDCLTIISTFGILSELVGVFVGDKASLLNKDHVAIESSEGKCRDWQHTSARLNIGPNH
jgi:hypothetical protein